MIPRAFRLCCEFVQTEFLIAIATPLSSPTPHTYLRETLVRKEKKKRKKEQCMHDLKKVL